MPKEIEGFPLRENIFFSEKKSHNAEISLNGDPLVQASTVCNAEEQEKPFWFSLLGEMVQFDTKSS